MSIDYKEKRPTGVRGFHYNPRPTVNDFIAELSRTGFALIFILDSFKYK